MFKEKWSFLLGMCYGEALRAFLDENAVDYEWFNYDDRHDSYELYVNEYEYDAINGFIADLVTKE